MTGKMTGSKMDFAISAHLNTDTEIEVKRWAGSSPYWSLKLGSDRYDSADGGSIVLFADTAADLLRVRDAITQAVEGGLT